MFFSSKVIEIQFCVWGLANNLTRPAFLTCILEGLWSHAPKKNSWNNEGQHPRATLLLLEGTLSEHKIIQGASYSSLWRRSCSNKSPQSASFPHPAPEVPSCTFPQLCYTGHFCAMCVRASSLHRQACWRSKVPKENFRIIDREKGRAHLNFTSLPRFLSYLFWAQTSRSLF